MTQHETPPSPESMPEPGDDINETPSGVAAVAPTPVEAYGFGSFLLRSLWRLRWVLVAAALAGTAAGFGLSLLQPERYEAAARLVLIGPSDASVRALDRFTRAEALFVESDEVAQRASDLLDGAHSPDQIGRVVSTDVSAQLNLVRIVATSGESGTVAPIANAVGEAYIQLRSEEQLEGTEAVIAEIEGRAEVIRARLAELEALIQLDPDDEESVLEFQRVGQELLALDARLDRLNSQMDRILVDAATYGAGVELFDRAETPRGAAQPQPARNAAAGGLVGLLAAAGYAIWTGDRTRAAVPRSAMSELIGAPMLAAVPALEGDPYEFAAVAVSLVTADAGGGAVIAITGVDGGAAEEPALGLAAAAARSGMRTVLVDANGDGGLSTRVGRREATGLNELAAGSTDVTRCITRIDIDGPAFVAFVSRGLGDRPPRFAKSEGLGRAFDKLRSAADIVVVSAPSVLVEPEALAMIRRADGVVVVVPRDAPPEQLTGLRERVGVAGRPVVGYVVVEP